jgi:O-antigen/teichoic acid export membrane protein
MMPSRAAAPSISAAARAETFLAARNALKLGASLVCTWGTALMVKLLVPRHLGPDAFGALSFADAFTATFFVALALGIDLYIRKEVSVRLQHAADFFGGTVALRIVLTAAIFGVIALVMERTHQPPHVRMLVYVYGLAQLFISFNATLSAILHCTGRVDGVSIIAVITKLTWAGGCGAAVVLGSGAWVFPASLLASEVLECGVLYWLARRHAGLRMRFDAAATWRVLVAAAPFYVNAAAYVAYSRLDVTVLERFAEDREVGWYGVAQAFAGLTMALTPFFGWVCMPILARAVARSQEEFHALLRRVLEYTLAAAIPLSLAVAVGADLWISVAFGQRFAPAAQALRILAPIAAVSYIAVIASCCMTLLGRGWRLTLISLVGLAVNIGLNLALIPFGLGTLGPGGGGAGAALASLGTELFVTAAMLWTIGRNAFDRHSLVRTAKLLAICAAVVALDRLFAPLGASRRVAADALAFTGLALAFRAVDVRAIARFTAAALGARRKESRELAAL